MSNYISNENQRLLWNAAHKIPTFAKLDPPKKEFEFKEVVEYIYRKYGTNRQTFTIPELQQVNRETLSVFLPKPSTVPVPSSVPYEMVESRQDKSMRAFQERQNVYENMNKKPDLPSPDDIFREKNGEEDKIQNMDELISNYQKQREMDYNVIAPPVLLPQPQNKKLKLLDETILAENDVDDLDNSQIQQQQKKSVSWKPELLEPSKIESLEMKIKELEKKNEDLENRMRELENRNDILERKMEELESHWREKKKTAKSLSLQKEKEISTIVDSTLKDMIHKIDKIDNIKNKMKMFSGGI